MFGNFAAGSLDGILDKCLVRQRLKGRSGLGDDDEDRTGDIDLLKHCRSVIRVNITDEFCLHLQISGDTCPVLQRNVQRTRAKIGSADTDLDDRIILLALLVQELAVMDFISEFGNSILLCNKEFSLVDAVMKNIFSELPAAELVQDHAAFSRIDDPAVIEFFIFLCELLFISKCLKDVEDLVIDLFRCIAVDQPASHRNPVFCNTFRSAFAGHSSTEIYPIMCFQQLK